ncbi:MAG: hypothetical protein ACLS8R_11025 [Anaeromassilibacillus sp.]
MARRNPGQPIRGFYEEDGLRILDTRPLLRAITGDLSAVIPLRSRGFVDACAAWHWSSVVF